MVTLFANVGPKFAWGFHDLKFFGEKVHNPKDAELFLDESDGFLRFRMLGKSWIKYGVNLENIVKYHFFRQLWLVLGVIKADGN